MNHIRFQRFGLLAALLAIVSFLQPVSAQVLYGSVVGLVQDPSGSSIPNAKVTVSNPATGVSYDATTDSDGNFTVLNVQPGTYDVKVGASGFKTASRTSLVVTANTVSRTDVRLDVGQVTENVTVAADAVQLQTDKADSHTEITAEQVRELPLPGFSNYQSLMNLVPGATPAQFQNSITDSPGRSLSVNVNGANRNTNVTRIDGAASVNLWLPHHVGYVMPAEMVETVNFSTTATDAEQGMAGGAAVTLITKSGTNQLHGSLFEYHDNQRLRARNPFNTLKPVRIYNNFGGSIGGPIVKNKLFFFYSYDNTKQRDGAVGVYSVPNAFLRTGNFAGNGRLFANGAETVLFDPATGRAGSRTPFPGNAIPANRISPQAQRIQAFLPLPTNDALGQGNFAIGATPSFNRDYNDAKINFNRNEKHSIWGRIGVMQALVGGRGVFGEAVGPAPGSDPGLGDTRVQNHSVGHSYTLSPTLLIDGVFGFQRMDQVVQGQDFGKDFATSLGIPGLGGVDPREKGFPNIGINGYNGTGVPGWMPLTRIEESFTTSHNVRYLRGAHNFGFGVDGVLHRMNHWQPELGGGPRGVFNFTGGLTSNTGNFNYINGYGDFLLGLANNGSKSIQHVLATAREWQFGFYAQDRWQVNRKLTVSMGLRYENYPLMGRSNGKGIERLDPETNQVFLGGRGNVPRNNGFTVSNLLFAPRVGVAYRVDDKTVIRGGYGMTYSPLPWSRPLRGMYPLTVNFSYVGNTADQAGLDLRTGLPPTIGPDLSSGIVNLPGAADMRSPALGRINRGYIQSWNFTTERRMPGQFVVGAAYVGTKSTNLMADLDINSGQVIGAGNAGRPYSARFGRNISTLQWQGFLESDYHALQTQVRRKAGNLMVQGAYTWSKAINQADDEGWQGLSWNYNPVIGRNRADAGYDRRHVFQMGWVYDLPFGEGQKFASNGPVKHILGGWSVSGVTAAFTGTPFTPSSPGGTLNLPGNAQTPDQVNLNVTRLEKIGSAGTFYDTSAFAPVTLAAGQAGRFGSMGRNSLRNPGSLRHDLTLGKKHRFGPDGRVEVAFRAEAYNFTNSRLSTGFGSGDVTNTNFLRVISAADERLFRLGLRIGF